MARRLRQGATELDAQTADALLRNDFATFARTFFPLVGGGEDLVWAPYLDLLSVRLADLVFGRTRRLIVNMPPRHLKSLFGSVLLPAFFHGHFPRADIMCVSYGQDLARNFGIETAKIMASAHYRELFRVELSSLRPPANLLRTRAGGSRRATSIDGVATGHGADLLIFDDPQKPGEILSDTVRATSNRAFEQTFLSRRNNPTEARMLVIMQRLHEDDFVGHVQALGMGWEVVNLPAIAEADEAMVYRSLLGRHVFRRREGEALHPERLPKTELDVLRDNVGEAVWAAQYQQRPTPAGGGLIRTEWLQPFDPDAPHEPYERIVQSWDTANKTNEWNDYSVCTTWGVRQKKFYLLHVFRQRLIYPELKARVLELADRWSANTVLIEDQASGSQLLQELPILGMYKTRACKPERDKAMRMSNQTGVMEAGVVLIPKDTTWRGDFLHELTMFPKGRYDDQVDSVSQALAYLTTSPSANGWFECLKEKAEEMRARHQGLPPEDWPRFDEPDWD